MTKCFITFHPADREHAAKFVEQFADVVTATLVGISDQDTFTKDVNEAPYVEREIREKYLLNTTVTIMLAGKCTWSHRFVDWEIAASLRKDADRGRSALLGIQLPYMATAPSTTVPERFQDNLNNGYAMFRRYPTSSDQLREWIQKAQEHRDTVTPDNTRALRKKDDRCK